MSYRTRQKKVKNRKRQAAIKRNVRSDNARWREEPATEPQWRVLGRITRETGKTFAVPMTKGEASELIAQRFDQDERAERAHRRSQRVLRRTSKQAQLGRVA